MRLNIYTELSDFAPNRTSVGVVLGGLAGIFYTLLIPMVMEAISLQAGSSDGIRVKTTILNFEVSQPKLATAFFLLCVLIFFFRFTSRLILACVSIELTAKIRKQLSQMILSAPTINLENIGPSKLVAVLTHDVGQIVNGAQMLPAFLTNLVNLVGCLGFLIYLNFSLFRMVMIAIIFGIITYQIPVRYGEKLLDRARKKYDTMYEVIRGIIYGAKDLKLDRIKRSNYLSEVLDVTQKELVSIEKKMTATYLGASIYGDMLGFAVIGVVSFIASNYYSISSEELVGIIMALLYISGPIAFILGVIPQLANARTSVNNVHKLFGEFKEESEGFTINNPNWQSIKMSEVTFEYQTTNHKDGFRAGPFNLEVRKGEITFIVGGNGSGKSTLGKLLALHYLPNSGVLSWGATAVTVENIGNMRQQIGAIFSDYYLFDRILRSTSKSSEKIIEHLELLNLNNKVEISNGVFSTLDLSDGQRRRLALLVTLIDDKEIYIFDEWAADQDPMFKDIFYRKILPDLKARGKLVLVISHDDRFFDVADQLIFMADGKIEMIKNQNPKI
jgi:putative ATP-binding cassette transporter